MSGWSKLCLACCCFSLVPHYIQADPIPQILVKASRLPVAADQAGSAVTVIDRSTIEASQAVFLTDLLRMTPALAVSRSGTFGSTSQVRIRGSEANQVLVVIDGVEVNDPSLGDEVDFAHLTTHAIERVEIVRGPQSALWGSDAVAGVINIVTRSADTGLGGAAFAEAGSFSTQHVGARIGHGGERHSVALDLSWLDTAGSNISRSGGEKDGYENFTANTKARYSISDAISVGTFLRSSRAEKDFDGIDFFVTGLPTDADARTEISQDFARLDADFIRGRWTHKLALSLLETNNENFFNGVFGSRQAAEKRGVHWQTGLQWKNSSLTLAVDHEEEDFSQRGTVGPFGDPNQDQSMSNTGYVAEFRTLLGDRVSLSLGTRFDQNSDFEDVFTYRGTASYAVNAAWRLRASVGTGLKRPTFTDRFGFFADQFVGNPNLDAEESRGVEVGFDYRVAKTLFEFGYFREKLEQEIDGFVFDPNSFLFTARNRDGESRRQGVEFAASGRPAEWFDWGISYSYVDADEPDGLGGQQREIRRPRHLGGFHIGVSALDERATVRLSTAVSGEQLDLFFPPFPLASERVSLSSFVLATLAAEYELGAHVRMVSRVENLLDEEYEEVLGFAQPGRGAYLGLRFDLR